jgi:hypothetical protein
MHSVKKKSISAKRHRRFLQKSRFLGQLTSPSVMRALNFDLTTTPTSSIANHPVELGPPSLAMQVRFPSWNSLQWESFHACSVGRQVYICYVLSFEHHQYSNRSRCRGTLIVQCHTETEFSYHFFSPGAAAILKTVFS